MVRTVSVSSSRGFVSLTFDIALYRASYFAPSIEVWSYINISMFVDVHWSAFSASEWRTRGLFSLCTSLSTTPACSLRLLVSCLFALPPKLVNTRWRNQSLPMRVDVCSLTSSIAICDVFHGLPIVSLARSFSSPTTQRFVRSFLF